MSSQTFFCHFLHFSCCIISEIVRNITDHQSRKTIKNSFGSNLMYVCYAIRNKNAKFQSTITTKFMLEAFLSLMFCCFLTEIWYDRYAALPT